jgi:hypothetical protein
LPQSVTGVQVAASHHLTENGLIAPMLCDLAIQCGVGHNPSGRMHPSTLKELKNNAQIIYQAIDVH